MNDNTSEYQNDQVWDTQYLQKLFIAALLVLYAPHPPVAPVAAPELTNMTFPLLCRNRGKALLTVWRREKKLTSKILFHSATVELSEPICPKEIRPAFRTNPSIRPQLSMAAFVAASSALQDQRQL